MVAHSGARPGFQETGQSGPNARVLDVLFKVGFLAWLVLVLLATLRPVAGEVADPPRFCLACGSFGLADLLVNLAMLLPLGFVAGFRWPHHRRLLACLVALPVVIELLQHWVPGRHVAPSDTLLNWAGIGAGYVLARTIRGLESRFPGSSIVAWALVAAGAVASFGLSQGSVLTDDPYFVHWNPSLAVIDPYPGAMVQAALGDMVLGHGGPLDSAPIAAAVRRGDTLSLRFRVAQPVRTSKVLGVFGVWDSERSEVLLVGLRQERLVIRGWRRANAWRLRSWNPGLPFEAGPIGSVATLRVWRAPDDNLCVDMAGVVRCETRPSIAEWWTALFGAPRESWVSGLSLFALATMMLPGGSLPASQPIRWMAIILVVGALAAVPALLGLNGVGFWGWVFVLVGGLVGRSIGRSLGMCGTHATRA